MTIDDENSIYVGGIPYDSTEDSLRKVFDIYGAVVAVKIINDRGIGGKCYSFVTFMNPRSAVHAINEMNGRMIGGRVVKVNEVNSRGGKSQFNREKVHRDSGRDMGWERGRERERNQDYDREHFRGRKNDQSRDRHLENETNYERPHSYDRIRDHSLSRDRFRDGKHNEPDYERSRSQSRDRITDRMLDRDRVQDHEQKRIKSHDREWGKEHGLDLNREIEADMGDHDREGRERDQLSKSQSGSHISDRQSRELSSNSRDDDEEVKEKLDVSLRRHRELEKEVTQMEEKLEEKYQHVSDLKSKSQKLEEALNSVRKLTTQREQQLIMVKRCFLQVKDYTEKLKSSEQELQSLVNNAMIEFDDGEDAANEGW